MRFAKIAATMNPRANAVAVISILWLLQIISIHAAAPAFVNFETAPVHPVALSADGRTLAVCNLPDARVEIFDLTGPQPRSIASVFTGIDPVTARFNANGELWVVN